MDKSELWEGCEIEKVATGPRGDLFEVRVPIRLTPEEIAELEEVTRAASWIKVRHLCQFGIRSTVRKAAEDLDRLRKAG